MNVDNIGRLTGQVNWLGVRVGGHLALFYIHQMNQVNSYNDLCRDDSTINIVKSIINTNIIIMIIIIKAVYKSSQKYIKSTKANYTKTKTTVSAHVFHKQQFLIRTLTDT